MSKSVLVEIKIRVLVDPETIPDTMEQWDESGLDSQVDSWRDNVEDFALNEANRLFKGKNPSTLSD